MTRDEVKASLAAAARRCWPDVTRASDLPFPEYWRGVTEFLTFHAPHVGDALMWKLVDGFAVSAKEAEERGETPDTPKVTGEVRAIYGPGGGQTQFGRQGCGNGERGSGEEAWAQAAERAQAVKDRMARRRRPKEGWLL